MISAIKKGIGLDCLQSLLVWCIVAVACKVCPFLSKLRLSSRYLAPYKAEIAARRYPMPSQYFNISLGFLAIMKTSSKEYELSCLVMQLDKQVKQLSKDLVASIKRSLALEEQLRQSHIDISVLLDRVNSHDY